MKLIEQLVQTPGINIHDVYSDTCFEVIVNEGTWYFVGEDRLGRIEVASQHPNDRHFFNSQTEAYKYIISTL